MVLPAGSTEARTGQIANQTGGLPPQTEDGSRTGEVAKGTAVGGHIGGSNIRVDVFDPPQGDARVKVTDLTKGRLKDGKPVGEWIARLDRAHKGAPYPHVNVQNMPPALKSLEALDHAKVPHVPTGALQAAKHIGKPLIVVGVVADAVDLKQSYDADKARGDGNYDETKRAVGRVAGGWGGAAAGAAAGAAIGSIVPGLGTAIGGVVGGVVGGIGGSLGGSKLGEWVAGWF